MSGCREVWAYIVYIPACLFTCVWTVKLVVLYLPWKLCGKCVCENAFWPNEKRANKRVQKLQSQSLLWEFYSISNKDAHYPIPTWCMVYFTRYSPLCHTNGLQSCNLSAPSLSSQISPGAHHTERTTEECTGCPGGKDSNPGLVWEWHQTRSPNEQVGPERGGLWRGWALSSTDWRFLPVLALQGWTLQSGLWIQWHCQGM